jgi:hypothetical protein
MKKIKDLLQELLNNKDLFRCGLCIWSSMLMERKKISGDEFIKLIEYIKINPPNTILVKDLYWKFGEIQPRILWINEHIKKLTEMEEKEKYAKDFAIWCLRHRHVGRQYDWLNVEELLEIYKEEVGIQKIENFVKYNEMSSRLKHALIIASKKYTYLNELSVIKFSKIRNVGLKSIKELLELIPTIENEVGELTTKNILNYKNKL